MKETLQRHNEVLDQIQKSLEDYLETKRIAFPRFYFLSNEELLQILAQTRDAQVPLSIFNPFNRLPFQCSSPLPAHRCPPTGLESPFMRLACVG